MLRAVEDRESSFPGLCVIYPALPNRHKVKILYKESQVNEVIYPDLIRALQEGGFQAEGDWWDLLITVAVGGTMSLNGPRYPKVLPTGYDTRRIHAGRTNPGPCTDDGSFLQTSPLPNFL
jgi:hypothetical protein